MAAVAELKNKKTQTKRLVLSMAAKMTSAKINEQVDRLLVERADPKKKRPIEDIELELTCWSEIWLGRKGNAS